MIKVIWTQNGVEYDLSQGSIAQDDTLASMVIYCLFTDARAKDADALPNGTDKRGWPGNTYSDFVWGSRLWLLSREKITSQTLFDAKSYAEEALKHITDNSLAEGVEVRASRTSRDVITLAITITLNDNSTQVYKAALSWNTAAAREA